MKIKIVILFSFLLALVAFDLTAEQVGKKFFVTLLKHAQTHNKAIFDKDFYYYDVELNETYRGDYITSEVLYNMNTDDIEQDLSAPTIYSFTSDGLLKIELLRPNGSTIYIFLAKPSNDIEGGYKLYAEYFLGLF